MGPTLEELLKEHRANIDALNRDLEYELARTQEMFERMEREREMLKARADARLAELPGKILDAVTYATIFTPPGAARALLRQAAKQQAARAGIAAIRYGPINAGPLPAVIANTFRGGSYTATTLTEATTFYRVYGGAAGQTGSFLTRTAPSGPLQSTIDLALNPQWGNTAAQVARIQVPAGTTIYEGAAAQGGLVGGGNQVFIPAVNPAWILP